MNLTFVSYYFEQKIKIMENLGFKERAKKRKKDDKCSLNICPKYQVQAVKLNGSPFFALPTELNDIFYR